MQTQKEMEVKKKLKKEQNRTEQKKKRIKKMRVSQYNDRYSMRKSSPILNSCRRLDFVLWRHMAFVSIEMSFYYTYICIRTVYV